MDIKKCGIPADKELESSYVNNILDRNSDIHNFISMLFSIEKGGVIAVDGDWGSGKTYFISQVKWLLDKTLYESKHENISKVLNVANNIKPKVKNLDSHKYKAFYYDAWKHDKSNNPFFTLLYELIFAFGGIDCFVEKKDAIGTLLSTIKNFANVGFQVDFEHILEGSKKLVGIKDIFIPEPEYISRIDEQVCLFLDYICENRYDKLVVFIDELDRCKPSFAVELLEVIKHYFNHDKIIFVLSTNLSEFQYCVKHYYGEGFNGWKYLDRFIDIRVTLPDISIERYYKYLWQKSSTDRIDDIATSCAKYFKFTLREIERYNQLINISIHNYFDCSKNNRIFRDSYDSFYILFSPLLIALKIHSNIDYDSFVDGKHFSIIKGLLLDESFYNNADFFLSINDSVSNQDNLVEKRFETCYLRIFSNETNINDDEIIDSIMLSDTRINSDLKNKLLNVSNLFSSRTSFDD